MCWQVVGLLSKLRGHLCTLGFYFCFEVEAKIILYTYKPKYLWVIVLAIL